MKKYICYILFLCYITSCGFFDTERAESKKIIGRMYVLNPHLPEDSGFYLIFRNMPKSDRFLLEYKHIDYLKSNDSVMLVKTKAIPDVAFYMIHHVKGDSIVNIQNLSDSGFTNYENKMSPKYYFVSDKEGK